MKTLADYKDDEALDVWVEILEPALKIFKDKAILKLFKGGKAPVDIAIAVLKKHKKEVTEILLAIDDEPITGVNIITRLAANIECFMKEKELRDFFASQAQKRVQNVSTPATESTEEKEH